VAEPAGRSLELGQVMGHVLKVHVNGKPAAVRLWPPWQADLSGHLREGDNTLELELTGGLRNLLGPHHLEEGETYAASPGCFFKEPNVWGCSPWNDDYCLVEFGVRTAR
jgi:hypothetical protein